MRARRSIALSVLAISGVLASACSSDGDNLSNAGIDNDSTTVASSSAETTAPVDTSTDSTDSTSSSDPSTTAATSTTEATGLGSLPTCDVDALDAADGPVTITFWHGMANELGAELTRLTEAYNSAQDRVVVDLQFQGGYDENIDKYLQSNTANRPDLVQMPEYMVQQMIDTKSIVPTQACAESAEYDLTPFLPQGLDAYASEGVQWSMPFNMSVPVLFFLEPRFVTAGLDPANPPQTLDDLLAASEQIVASGASPFSIALDSDFDGGGGWYIEQWLAKAGELYADNDNGRAAPATKVLYDEAPGVELLTYLQALVDTGGAVYVGDNASGSDTLLKLADPSAPASMTIATSASLGPILSVLGSGLIPGVTAEDVGVGPMPGPDGGAGALVGGASLYIVADKGDEKAAAAWDFMTYLLDAPQQAEWASATGYIPVRSDALELDPIKTKYVDDPRFKVAYDQLVGTELSAATRGPVIGPLLQVRKVTAAAVAAVLGGADPATALADAADQANDLITNYNSANG